MGSCSHKNKYLNVVSKNLSFWYCPDCENEVFGANAPHRATHKTTQAKKQQKDERTLDKILEEDYLDYLEYLVDLQGFTD